MRTMPASRIRGTIFEGADYLLDLETSTTSRRKKRSRHDFRKRDICISEFVRSDEAYAKLLDYLLGPSDSEMEEDEDEDDSTYMMFLENLKEHGNSYILDVALDHGVLFPIKYETEEVPFDKLKRRLPQSCSSNSIQNSRSLGVNGAMESGKNNFNSLKEYTLIQKSSRLPVDGDSISGLKNYVLGREYTQISNPRVVENLKNAPMQNSVRKSSEEIDYSSGQDCRSRSRAELSEKAPTMQILSKTLTPNPTPRAPTSTSTFTPRTSIGCSSGRDHRSNSRADTMNESYRVFISGLQTNGDSVFYEYGDGKRVYYEGDDQQKSTDIQNKSLGPPIQSPTPSQPTQTLRAPPPTRAFIPRPLTAEGHGKTQNDQSVTTFTAQIPISKLPSSSQPAPTPRAPTSTFTPTLRTLTSKTPEHQGNPSMRSHSWFHERLESICSEPYKKKEYEDLLEQVNLRKPITVHKDTRGSEYSRPGEMGKSYLDSFPDLDHEIKKVEFDPHKVLNLLRGFFFYLQKVPRGVPRPWRDETCRAIMLGERLGDS